MKAYILTPDELAEEGKKLEAAGLDQFTIMDSAGTMLPDEVAAYTEKLCRAVTIPVAFHGHNNLGMSAANAVCRMGERSLHTGLRPDGNGEERQEPGHGDVCCSDETERDRWRTSISTVCSISSTRGSSRLWNNTSTIIRFRPLIWYWAIPVAIPAL